MEAATAPTPAAAPTNAPSIATLVLGLIAGVLTVLVHNTFGIAAPWTNYAAITLVFLSALGISPLVGSAFKNALHLPPAASLIITAALTAAAVGATQISLSPDTVGIVQGVIAFLSALGFGIVPPATLNRFVS